ncbi:MAG: class I SAM-dependent methyltransferase, partial [Clostridia bacterium]
MKQMELTARLKQIADMVPQGFSVADIGTDHGYLPIYLVVKGISPCVLACDLRPGPLERAKAHVREYGLEEQIRCRLSDGLEGVMSGEASVVVMAGIGGHLCSDLLLQESQREKNILPTLKALLLQPQSDLAVVRHTVHGVGFGIEKEARLEDRGKRYT